MKNNTLKKSLWAVLLLLCFYTSNAQVGIGTTSPDVSSMLEVNSTTQGLLTPRMTTAQRNAIASPADGLIVYDTTLKSFYYYNAATPIWTVINSGANGRLKFKRIKSTDVLATVLASEKTAGANVKYVLATDTYYEINGTINVDLPIDLNNAYLVGLDANEDRLIRTTGNLFDGSTGGTIKNITISVTGGNVFTLSGVGNTENFLVRDCIIANCSNVGSISGFGLVFFAIVQYSGNTTGITYNNITRLLLSNTAWFGNNTGTFEKYTGSFSLIQKQGGFCEVNGTAIGVDVSSNPTITSDAVMETVVFTGTLSTGLYVKGYSPAMYTGYNFNNNWNIRCSGIPTEVDASASGNLYKSSLTGVNTLATISGTNYKVQTTATTTTNLFRFESTTTGRLTYKGKKTRAFQATASYSFQENTGSTNTDYVFFLAKISANGLVTTPLPETETYIDTNSGFVQAFPVTGTITLAEGESVELFLRRIGSGNRITISTLSYNLSLK